VSINNINNHTRSLSSRTFSKTVEESTDQTALTHTATPAPKTGFWRRELLTYLTCFVKGFHFLKYSRVAVTNSSSLYCFHVNQSPGVKPRTLLETRNGSCQLTYALHLVILIWAPLATAKADQHVLPINRLAKCFKT
jgi:hypothetical protein